MNPYLKPLDFTKENLSTLMYSIVSVNERYLYSFPIRDGGLEIPILQNVLQFIMYHQKQ